ncbi:UNVERIFIED_CONTAM: hypothetical protein GTU68_019112 [Idotea baltica]|nr:hypothetical protein [Idotea baltica]
MLGQIDISNRQAEIADLVQKTGFASVEDLAERFEVTTQTIRRDVNGLCELGILRRTHGGVEPPAPAANIHYSTRQILNLREKQLIAKLVAGHVDSNQALAFSIGTTPEIVMQALTGHDKLAVFTNNLNVAFTASVNPSFQVTIAGGRLRHGDRDVLGSAAQAFFANYKVDIGIFGVAGVDEDGTLLDFHEDEVAASVSRSWPIAADRFCPRTTASSTQRACAPVPRPKANATRSSKNRTAACPWSSESRRDGHTVFRRLKDAAVTEETERDSRPVACPIRQSRSCLKTVSALWARPRLSRWLR